MKKTSLISLILVAILMIGTVAPAFAATPSGSWEINTKVGSYVSSGDKKVFNKAVKGLGGVAYTPVFTLATQVVAGMNYAFFCKAVAATASADASWCVLIVNEDPQGKVKLLQVNEFDFTNIKTRKSVYKSPSSEGGWSYNSKSVSSKGIPSAASKAFKKAAKKYTGVSLKPLALLGTQVVSGTNYKFLCRGVTSNKAKTVCLYEVTVYKNLKGKCKITDCNVINLPKYLKH